MQCHERRTALSVITNRYCFFFENSFVTGESAELLYHQSINSFGFGEPKDEQHEAGSRFAVKSTLDCTIPVPVTL